MRKFSSLARKHHPDTAKQNDKTATAEFIKLSEAWSVLSKPETKSKYDILRREYLMRTVGRTVNLPDREISSAQREIHQGFNIQKDHYSSVVSARASSNWQDIQDKYRTTKWQSMSLKDRKVSASLSLLLSTATKRCGVTRSFPTYRHTGRSLWRTLGGWGESTAH